MEKLCYGCMRMKQRSPLCEHCGYNENIDNMPHQLPLGTILGGRYEVGKVLGQGGFGITYIGRDVQSDALVAIKEFYPRSIVARDCGKSTLVSISEKESSFLKNKERFLREARILTKFTHIPSVVHVYSFFEENDTAYIVMEYVQGVTMKAYINLRGGRLSPEHTIRLLEPVMEALEAVHAEKLVHRDISPDNIMILPDGSAKLLDFGAARELEQDADGEELHSTEAILKHGFAPIEQYQRRGNLGPWTDVYALCGTIYYSLTGRIPRDATERITEDASMNWEKIAGLTARQINALERGMAPNLKYRTQSVGQLRKELVPPRPKQETVVQKPPEKETPPPEKKEAPKPQKKPPAPSQKPETGKQNLPLEKKKPAARKIWSALAACLVLLVIGGALVGYSQGWFDGILATTESEPEVQLQVQTEPQVLTEPQVSTEAPRSAADNILREDIVDVEGWGMEEDVVRPVFGSGINRNQIRTITFLDTLKDAPQDAMDVSQTGDGSVLCWMEPGGVQYDMFIAGEGGVTAPRDCTALFAFYSSAVQIDFNGCFHTENTVSMHDMFLDCGNLEIIDMSGLDTSSVTDMIALFHGCHDLREVGLEGFDTSAATDIGYMFADCESLESVDLSGFDTGNVTSLYAMFLNCKSLSEVDLGSFDTGNVVDMGYMFSGCMNLAKADVSSFDTSAVTNMGAMFENCYKLAQLDIQGFVTENVTDMFHMFYNCNALKDMDFSNFDTSSVTNYFEFMNNSTRINGIPWTALFEKDSPEETEPEEAFAPAGIATGQESVEAVETNLDVEDYTFRREWTGDDVMIYGEHLMILVEDGKKVTITIDGLSLENGYSTNKWYSTQNQLEYYWGLEMTGEETYAIATAAWAYQPRFVSFTPLPSMESAAWIVTEYGPYEKMGSVSMTHTETSITWKYTINRYYPSGFENMEEFVVRSVDTSTDRELLRTYRLEQE